MFQECLALLVVDHDSLSTDLDANGDQDEDAGNNDNSSAVCQSFTQGFYWNHVSVRAGFRMSEAIMAAFVEKFETDLYKPFVLPLLNILNVLLATQREIKLSSRGQNFSTVLNVFDGFYSIVKKFDARAIAAAVFFVMFFDLNFYVTVRTVSIEYFAPRCFHLCKICGDACFPDSGWKDLDISNTVGSKMTKQEALTGWQTVCRKIASEFEKRGEKHQLSTDEEGKETKRLRMSV